MSARIAFDPLQVVCEIFNERHPDKDVVINWMEGMKEADDAWGQTWYNADGSLECIVLDTACPFFGLVEILAHELAHVAVGTTHDDETGHGSAWQAEFDAIHSEYSARVLPAEEHQGDTDQ